MLFFTSATRAQFSRLDDLASQLAKKLKPVKPQLVAVADFRAPYGSDMPQEHYFAWLLSDDLRILVITSSEAQLVLTSRLGALLADRFSEPLNNFSRGLTVVDRQFLKDYLRKE